jgi:hypothetical protein
MWQSLHWAEYFILVFWFASKRSLVEGPNVLAKHDLLTPPSGFDFVFLQEGDTPKCWQKCKKPRIRIY